MPLSLRQLARVQADRRFNAILSADPVLDALDAEKYNRSEEFAALAAVIGGRFAVSDSPVEFPPLTPAVWAVLWMLESPFTRTNGTATEADADLFLYLLHTGIERMPDLGELPTASAGFVRGNGMDPVDAILSIRQMVYIAFRPLEMLPARQGDTEAPCYDADWLTRLAATVCRETNFDADHVIFSLPLSSCYYYVIQSARRNNTKSSIQRRSDGEVCEAIHRRTMELAEKFYNEVLTCPQL